MGQLIVLRGNSGSGKSTVALELRRLLGPSVAWIEQDHFRRSVFQETTEPDPLNALAIEQVATLALAHGRHAIVEGIMPVVRYGEMLRRLIAAHPGRAYCYYFDIPFAETTRRHATRSKSTAFTAEAMREWYLEEDLLGDPHESIIGASSSLDEIVARVLAETGLRPAV
ncbi:AAA family ATPase [Kribbella sp. NPDC051770]|uniref:AAA family ATPase n=1 Tax=Kribbella sp. NPDC051770 TaxID=3155413 RepID=UPI0034384998